MSIILLINISVMILERYINRTFARVTIKKIGKGKEELTEEQVLTQLQKNQENMKS